MPVDKEKVRHVARLARIALPPERLEPMVAELNRILQWVEQLKAVDTDAVEPMTSVVKVSLKTRDDVVTDGDRAAAVVQNAPGAEDNYFAVPKVVE